MWRLLAEFRRRPPRRIAVAAFAAHVFVGAKMAAAQGAWDLAYYRALPARVAWDRAAAGSMDTARAASRGIGHHLAGVQRSAAAWRGRRA